MSIDPTSPALDLDPIRTAQLSRVCRAISDGDMQALGAVAPDIAQMIEAVPDGLQKIWVWSASSVRRYSMWAGPLSSDVIAALRYVVRETQAILVIHSIGSPPEGATAINRVCLETRAGRVALDATIPSESDLMSPVWLTGSEPASDQPLWFTPPEQLAPESQALASTVLADHAELAQSTYRARRGPGTVLPAPGRLM